MKEQSNRRIWVKRVAIVFFTIMLLLTFFSNTIMNYSLPRVSTHEIDSDKISLKVRGSGIIESAGLKEVVINESREVTDVLVKVGDEVKEGDVLIKLKEGESTELMTAEKELESLKQSYQNQILLNEISKDLVDKAESGGINYDTATKELEKLRKVKEEAEKKVQGLQKQLQELQKQLEEKETVDNEFFESDMSQDSILDNLTDNANEKNNESISIEQQKIAEINNQLETANSELVAATEAHAGYLENITTVNELKSQYEAIKECEAEVEKLKKNIIGTEIKAQVSGIIMSVDVKKKELTMPEFPLITIQDKTKGYTVSINVSKEQASRVKKGDEAEISNGWYYDDAKAVLSNIKVDTDNPGKGRVLVFDISGSVTVGEEMSLSVGEKSRSYDYVVPNSAIKEDKNGKFILVIKEKSSPLGNRYIASRVDVEILAFDDSKTAVKGAIEGSEYVITTANKMVNAGDYVRFAD